MAPEIISEWKGPDLPDRKEPEAKAKFLCDVYSYGILANELVTRKPPYEGKPLENSNCYDRIVINIERPVTKIELPPQNQKAKKKKSATASFELVNNNHFTLLIEMSWNQDPGKRSHFAELLKKLGELDKIKKNIAAFKYESLSENLRNKLKNKMEGNDIDFPKFLDIFSKVYSIESTHPFSSFIKELLVDKSKVTVEFANRFCDWMSEVTNDWIRVKYKQSTFYLYYFGEKTTESIKKDNQIWKSSNSDSKCRAVLHWDPNAKIFKLTVRDNSKCGNNISWEEVPLKEMKSFMALEGINKKIWTQKFHGRTPTLVLSTYFDRLKLKDPTPHTYVQTEDHTKHAGTIIN